MNQGHKYQITVIPIADDALGATGTLAPLVFMHENHDDLALVVERVRKSTGLDADSAAATAIGLKLLGEVILKQRGNALFDALRNPVREFIHTLKSLGARGADRL